MVADRIAELESSDLGFIHNARALLMPHEERLASEYSTENTYSLWLEELMPNRLLSEFEESFLAQTEEKMNHGAYVEASNDLKLEFESRAKSATFFGASLAGLLIDVGNENQSLQSVEAGLSYFEAYHQELKNVIQEWSLEYNLGNAKKTIFDIKLQNIYAKYSAETSMQLVEAKNHYWRAYKFATESGKIDQHPQILVNLANCLSTSGRISEALYYFDMALEKNCHFHKAHINRARALEGLNDLSESWTLKLLAEVIEGYQKASNDSNERWIAAYLTKKLAQAKKVLLESGGAITIEDQNQTEVEFKAMPIHRQKHILDKLTLNEHALYCRCLGCERDNLTVSLKTLPIISDNTLGKMEHYLNRFKSEFSVARKLLYDARSIMTKEIELIEYDNCLTNLGTDEAISHNIELLRTSFRVCIGILDKIAEAICELFDFASTEEKIYFDTFWKKNPERWEKINQAGNPSLVALYSQSTDLNMEKGEWAHFKSWRNSLEHGLFVIFKNNTAKEDRYAIFQNRRRITLVDEQEFVTAAEHLLQFTRSAIFNFTFCARTEFLKRSRSREQMNFDLIELRPVIENNCTIKILDNKENGDRR